jgi:NADP-dependent 3-hydroxy acid dehydrogenase YdfG
MVEQGSGDIVNISSVAGRTARRGAGVYNASKWAVNAFSESLRQEVTARGVRISLVEPGAVATELSGHITQEQAREPRHVGVNAVLVRPADQER